MAVAKKKLQPRTKRATAPEVGPDGLTLPKRLWALMHAHEPPIGQTGLARMCSEYYATFVPSVDDKVKQQHIFNILNGQASAEHLPLIAAVLDVNELWLQYGIGPKERSQRA